MQEEDPTQSNDQSRNLHMEEGAEGPLERQVVRASIFAHSSLSTQATRINEIEAFLYGVIDTLIEQGTLKEEALSASARRVREEILEKREHFHIGVALRKDPPTQAVGIPVDCDKRLHLCRAACCKLNFALNMEELESGKVKWDLGQPYFIRQEKTGYCTHLNTEKQCCSIYNDRPKPCRGYTCAEDKRIWKDFEKMIPNSEWMDEHLKAKEPGLRRVEMHTEDKLDYGGVRRPEK